MTKTERRRNAAIVRRLTQSLAVYVSPDDTTLQRLEFLQAVQTRVKDDLKAASRILAGAKKQRRVE